MATLTKPLVVGSTGVTVGAAAAMAMLARFGYATDKTVLAFPHVTAGLAPSGGASYALSRLPNGYGMYAALTGAPVVGQEAYWSGMLPYYATAESLEGSAQADAAHGAGDPLVTRAMEYDWRYRKALAELSV
jgi:enoyl-CoA hydratase